MLFCSILIINIFSLDKVKFCIDNNPVMWMTEFISLGIYIDDNLSWKYCINYIKFILSRNIGFTPKKLYSLDSKCAKKLY